jgi:sugar lactone lactonase YvrE
LSDDIEVVYQISLAPSGLTCSPDGNWLLSLNQTEKPRARVVSVNKTGKVDPFPSAGMSEALPDEPLPLDAVEGMQLDANGVVWLLDNGRRSEVSPKIIGWQPDKNRLISVHHIGQPAVVPGSFFADLAVDPNSPFIYISDPASGADAAIIALDRSNGLARRLLQGHPSVVPDGGVPMPLAAIGSSARRLDGVQTLPHSGADPIALDRKGEWLYFAPLRSAKLYRIKTEHLRSLDLSRERLASLVEVYADKPPTSSISLDNKGNVYLGDFSARAIGVIEENTRKYRSLASDPRLVSPNGLCFGNDGKLYFFSRSQFAAPDSMSAKNATVSVTSTTTAEHSLYRMKALSSGRVGD